MDKQQFDHIENRIRKAADEISIPANDVAWEKMQVLLDEEFNKERRRRGGLWWWLSSALIIATGLGIYLYVSQQHGPSDKKLSLNNVANQTTIPTPTPLAPQKASTIDTKRPENANSAIVPPPKATGESSLEKDNISSKHQPVVVATSHSNNAVAKKVVSSSVRKNANLIPGTGSNRPIGKTRKSSSITTRPEFPDRELSPNSKTKNNRESELPPGGIKAEASQTNSKDVVNSDKPSGTDSSQKSDLTKTVVPGSTVQADSLEKPGSSNKNTIRLTSKTGPSKGFYLTGSVAADATGIKKFSTKDIKPVYGIGVGYSFNKRWSVQTGFYAGKKIYSAGPDDYKVKPGSYVAKIISAEAECYIYDIPLSIRYNALTRNMYNVYFTTGLSSYILKRETYDMHFYNPTGTYRHMSYTYSNNRNYFSILNLSVGFEHKLSRSFYIQAEPYFKLPLAGLGEGDVKLYSGGVQLGFKYQHATRKK